MAEHRWFVWRRVLPAVVLGEIVPILVLVAAVAAWGPSDPLQAEAFARRLGRWVGPAAGALAILGLSAWAGLVTSRPVIQGALIGLVVALVDLGILAVSGEPFAWLFLGSNVLRVVAGASGGWIAGRWGREMGSGD